MEAKHGHRRDAIKGKKVGIKHKKPGAGKKPVFKRKKKESKSSQLRAAIDSLTAQYDAIDPKNTKIFSDLPLSEATQKGLQEAGYNKPTEIQRESIGLALRGLDILGAAKTGSGKTLAFIIPIFEKLYTSQWSRIDGVGALVITPTRELAYQIFETLRRVGQYHEFSAGLVIGGKDLKFEWKRVHSCNILVCTPGRLLQHLDENPAFSMENLQILVLDEADRCLDLGFKEAMNAIVAALPTQRQTLLFSATQTRSVTDLARLSLEQPVFVSVHEKATHTTPDTLTQSYIVTDLHHKVNILWSFLKNHKKKKILVFMQSCKQVKYIYEIFCRLRPGVSVLALYGSLHQLKRMTVYDQFCGKEHAVLFATDIAARGLDFPAVDWVVQLDCPEDGVTYVHRAGRTARYNTAGESLLVLLPQEEEGMLKQLQAHKVPISKIEVNPAKLQQIEKKIASHLASDKNLKESAQRAFQSYIKSVFLMRNKAIFQVDKLDTAKFAESLGLAVPPRVRFLEKRKRAQQLQHQQKVNGTTKASPQQEDSDSDATSNSEDEDVIPYHRKKIKDKEKTADKDKDSFIALVTNSDEEEEGEEVLKVKRHHHDLEADDPGDDETLIAVDKKVAGKGMSKVQAAKKVLKKKIVANSRLLFDEATGDAVVPGGERSQAASELGRKYESEGVLERPGGGIDIAQAREVMRAEDKFDREAERRRQKEKRRELKQKAMEERKRKREEQEEEDSESEESVDLSWLPDPDKLYGEKDGSDSEFETEVKKRGDKVTTITKRIPKRVRKDESDEEDEEERVMDTGLSLEDDEDLALRLLGR